MEAKCKEKSEQWKNAIGSEFKKLTGINPDCMSVLDQLQAIFDDEVGIGETDEQVRKRLVHDNDLHVTIQGAEWRHVSRQLKEAYLLLQNVFSSSNTEKKIQKINNERDDIHLGSWGSYASPLIIDLQMEVSYEFPEMMEFVYWTKDRIALVSFVHEIDYERIVP